MKNLVDSINQLKNSEVKQLVDTRMRELKEIGRDKDNSIFKELCFCLLTANYSAEGGIRIQKEVADGFLTLPYDELVNRLMSLGHRFPNARATYIIEARNKCDFVTKIDSDDEHMIRDLLVKNIKGLGYKEASHFMRNIGYENVAIIDFHIIDLLVRHNLIEKLKTLTKKKYLDIENVLSEIAKRANLNLAELDFYLWYMETGKVLK